jgi:hypothetical protein
MRRRARPSRSFVAMIAAVTAFFPRRSCSESRSSRVPRRFIISDRNRRQSSRPKSSRSQNPPEVFTCCEDASYFACELRFAPVPRVRDRRFSSDDRDRRLLAAGKPSAGRRRMRRCELSARPRPSDHFRFWIGRRRLNHHRFRDHHGRQWRRFGRRRNRLILAEMPITRGTESICSA